MVQVCFVKCLTGRNGARFLSDPTPFLTEMLEPKCTAFMCAGHHSCAWKSVAGNLRPQMSGHNCGGTDKDQRAVILMRVAVTRNASLHRPDRSDIKLRTWCTEPFPPLDLCN